MTALRTITVNEGESSYDFAAELTRLGSIILLRHRCAETRTKVCPPHISPYLLVLFQLQVLDTAKLDFHIDRSRNVSVHYARAGPIWSPGSKQFLLLSGVRGPQLRAQAVMIAQRRVD